LLQNNAFPTKMDFLKEHLTNKLNEKLDNHPHLGKIAEHMGLRKPIKVNLKETNLLNFGGDLERSIKKASGEGEPFWKNAGKKDGLEIWRVNQFKLVEVPEKSHGQFYSGDSYIVLRTYRANPNSDSLSWDIHFWLGSETTQDEAGTAAYKTVELDDYLGGKPVEHREVEGQESDQFKSYFKHGIRTQQGGFETGFNHVKPEEFRHRLLRVHGDKKYIEVNEVPLSVQSLNSGDPFILDKGENIYIWVPPGSQLMEKSKVGQVAKAIQDERQGKAKLHFQEEEALFWKALGFNGPQSVAPPLPAEHFDTTRKIYKLSDSSGNLSFTKIAEGKDATLSALKSDDVFIVDVGYHVFVWIGKKASVQERRSALNYAQQYLVKNTLDPQRPITRLQEGDRNEEFSF